MLNGLAEYIFGTGKSSPPREEEISEEKSLSYSERVRGTPPAEDGQPGEDEWILVKADPSVGSELSSRSSSTMLLVPELEVLERRDSESFLMDDTPVQELETGESVREAAERNGRGLVEIRGGPRGTLTELLHDEALADRTSEYYAKNRDTQGRIKRSNKTQDVKNKTKTRRDKRGKNFSGRSNDRKVQTQF